MAIAVIDRVRSAVHQDLLKNTALVDVIPSVLFPASALVFHRLQLERRELRLLLILHRGVMTSFEVRRHITLRRSAVEAAQIAVRNMLAAALRGGAIDHVFREFD